MAKRNSRKAGIFAHATAAGRTIEQAESFAAGLKAALAEGAISRADAEAMLADMASSGGAATALAGYVEGIIGGRKLRAPVKKARK